MANKVQNISPTGVVQTTDNTDTVIIDYPVPEDCTMFIKANVMARKVGDTVQAVYYSTIGIKRIGTGNAVIIGVVASKDSFIDVGAATWGINFEVSGSNIQVVVNGQVSTTIDWGAQLDTVQLVPNGGGS